MRITQETDKLVDAREEVLKLKAKDFEPEKYFVEGKIFYGLDENDQPIYFDLKEFFTTHHAILGPTSYGKSVSCRAFSNSAFSSGSASSTSI